MSQSSVGTLDKILAQLRAEHNEIQSLLTLYTAEPAWQVRQHLLVRLCRTLRLHCTLEAGIFIPAVAAASGSRQLLEQTGRAFGCVMGMVNELACDKHSTEYRDRLVTELGIYVNEHISTAESKDGVLSKSCGLRVDWATVANDIAQRRMELSRHE